MKVHQLFRCVFCNLFFWIFIWHFFACIAQCSFPLVAVFCFVFLSLFFSHMIEVFRLIALSGQAVDYCRYLSYYMSKEGHLYVFQC